MENFTFILFVCSILVISAYCQNATDTGLPAGTNLRIYNRNLNSLDFNYNNNEFSISHIEDLVFHFDSNNGFTPTMAGGIQVGPSQFDRKGALRLSPDGSDIEAFLNGEWTSLSKANLRKLEDDFVTVSGCDPTRSGNQCNKVEKYEANFLDGNYEGWSTGVVDEDFSLENNWAITSTAGGIFTNPQSVIPIQQAMGNKNTGNEYGLERSYLMSPRLDIEFFGNVGWTFFMDQNNDNYQVEFQTSNTGGATWVTERTYQGLSGFFTDVFLITDVDVDYFRFVVDAGAPTNPPDSTVSSGFYLFDFVFNPFSRDLPDLIYDEYYYSQIWEQFVDEIAIKNLDIKQTPDGRSFVLGTGNPVHFADDDFYISNYDYDYEYFYYDFSYTFAYLCNNGDCGLVQDYDYLGFAENYNAEGNWMFFDDENAIVVFSDHDLLSFAGVRVLPEDDINYSPTNFIEENESSTPLFIFDDDYYYDDDVTVRFTDPTEDHTGHTVRSWMSADTEFFYSVFVSGQQLQMIACERSTFRTVGCAIRTLDAYRYGSLIFQQDFEIAEKPDGSGFVITAITYDEFYDNPGFNVVPLIFDCTYDESSPIDICTSVDNGNAVLYSDDSAYEGYYNDDIQSLTASDVDIDVDVNENGDIFLVFGINDYRTFETDSDGNSLVDFGTWKYYSLLCPAGDCTSSTYNVLASNFIFDQYGTATHLGVQVDYNVNTGFPTVSFAFGSPLVSVAAGLFNSNYYYDNTGTPFVDHFVNEYGSNIVTLSCLDASCDITSLNIANNYAVSHSGSWTASYINNNTYAIAAVSQFGTQNFKPVGHTYRNSNFGFGDATCGPEELDFLGARIVNNNGYTYVCSKLFSPAGNDIHSEVWGWIDILSNNLHNHFSVPVMTAGIRTNFPCMDYNNDNQIPDPTDHDFYPDDDDDNFN